MAKWKAYRKTIRAQKLTSSYKQIRQNKQKHRYEILDEPIKQPYRRFLRIDLALKVIMDCKTD